MTDHTIARHEIISRNENRLQLSRLFHNWKVRRKVRAMIDNDDHILDDIGVLRHEVQWAARLPLTVNSAIALSRRAKLRRAGEFRRAR